MRANTTHICSSWLSSRSQRWVSSSSRAGHRPKQLRLARSGRPENQDALAATHPDLGLSQAIGRGWGLDFETVDLDRAGFPVHVADPALEVLRLLNGDERMAEACHAQQRRAPVGKGAEIIDEPAQR